MNRLNLRRLTSASILAGLCLGLIIAPRASEAQVKVLPGGGAEAPEASTSVIEKFTFPEDRDTSMKFEAVLDYLENKNIDWAVVCKLAQGLLSAKSDYFYQYKTGEKRRVSVKDEVSRLIGKFNRDGRDHYENTFGSTAKDLLAAAQLNGYNQTTLAECSQQYFHTKAGLKATLILARLQLEFGNYAESAYTFRRLMSHPDADTVLDAKALIQAAVAFKRTGDVRDPQLLTGLWEKIEKVYPQKPLEIGNRLYTLEQIKTEYDRNVELLYGKVSDSFIAMKGGNVTRNGVSEAGTPFLIPAFSIPLLYNTDSKEMKNGADKVAAAIKIAYDKLSRDKNLAYLPAMFPLTAPNLIIFRNYEGVYAFYTKETVDASGTRRGPGSLAWVSHCFHSAQMLFSDNIDASQNEKNNVNQMWWPYWSNAMPSSIFENSLLGSMSHDGRNVYVIDDLAVLPNPQLMYNEWGGFNPVGMPNDQGNKGRKDYNVLSAIDINTGSRVWALGGIGPELNPGEEDNITSAIRLLHNSHILGPPITINGKLYLLFEINSKIKMACLDPHKIVDSPNPNPTRGVLKSPELIWVQNLGQAQTGIKQDPLRHMQAAMLASADGIIICPTNAGAVVAVDVNARSLLWAHTYSSADKGTELGGGNRLGVIRRPFPNPQPTSLPVDRWRSASPIITGNRVIMTAYDSDQLQCLDLRSGAILWSQAREKDDLYVGGVSEGNVIIVGKNGVRAVKVVGESADSKSLRETVVTAWHAPLKITRPLGHGTVSKDGLFYLPVEADPDKPDIVTPTIWAIHTGTGVVRSKTVFRSKESSNDMGQRRQWLGNLVFHDNMMYSQSASEISAFPLIEFKRREMDTLLANNPKDPEGLTSRGELFLDDGKLTEAIADFKLAIANNPTEITRKKIDQKLYMAYTEILRQDFSKAESFLDEYKSLCNFKLDAEDGSPELGRQKEELTRRMGLYYSLVAKGREKQGRLVDAFDHYQAYAALGESDRLLAVPEDPNTLALSSVWASGRIDAMMRNAKNPADRKPLEDRVEQEWNKVKNAQDLMKLENFVRTFGPYFNRGRDAQFLLAEKLMQTNNDADKRKAQNYLLNLMAISDSDKNREVAAKATDALARLLTARNMMDDAVGLYARLGNDFAEVAIRDSKTGSDIYGDLVTDKRLLPFLEPARPTALGKYTVEHKFGNNSFNGRNNSLTLAPEGDLLPFFKRFRVSFDYDQNNGQTFISVLDRVTGETHGKFPITGVQPYQFYNQNSTTNWRIAQANGHNLLVHLGQYVYCFDLTQKTSSGQIKELWKKNVFGENGAIVNPNNPNQQLQQEGAVDGDLVFRSPDGWSFRMGRSAVLQSSYAAIITRDGLLVVDPLTGTKLWTRSNVTSRAMVYGDAKHIYLIEGTAGNYSAKVLRASDGAIVEGIKDFSALMSGSNKTYIFGRHILISSGGTRENPRTIRLYDILEGKDVWKREIPGESVALTTFDPEICGAVNSEGQVQIFASRTGTILLNTKTDAHKLSDHLHHGGKFNLQNPILLADADRFYVFLNREDKGPNQNVIYWGASPVRMTSVNGACYAFDKSTGKRLWYTDNQFARMNVCIERFEDMPCILGSNPSFTDPNAEAARRGQYFHKLVAVDKATGQLRLFEENLQSNGPFQSLTHNTKDGSFELWQYNLSVKIKAE